MICYRVKTCQNYIFFLIKWHYLRQIFSQILNYWQKHIYYSQIIY